MNIEQVWLIGWAVSVVGWITTLLLWHPWRRRRLVVKCEHPDCSNYQVIDELSDGFGQAYHPLSKSWPPPDLTRLQ